MAFLIAIASAASCLVDLTSFCESSATMDLAYTAMGAFDIWWEGGCWEW